MIAFRLNAWMGAEIVAAVAIAAYAAHRAPRLRVAMWTCLVVLMTAQAGESLELVALRRATEVIFGASVAWAFHWIADRIVGPDKAPPNEATG